MTTQEPDSGWQARFFTIWGGQAFSLVGSALVRFALIWWLTAETESATVLTTATLVSMLPFIVLAPLSGALVDRHLGCADRTAHGCVGLSLLARRR